MMAMLLVEMILPDFNINLVLIKLGCSPTNFWYFVAHIVLLILLLFTGVFGKLRASHSTIDDFLEYYDVFSGCDTFEPTMAPFVDRKLGSNS
jgi:hypothetical protein